ncbi:helix-turn-helix domain-containing protein [Geminocystis sp. NIES-3709]|uniref:helix-turn-helix domain-containing protein n=1 Tax=Geminocystis sp. NIES-3709 TaxID=1617448 RepID=UPI0005FC44AA|nr:helix-turn-helix domain-containing protein [Geminocystis sp. NIES-3709]BAQ65923.1 mobile element protein [Geminocystis sp. NIES-3709]
MSILEELDDFINKANDSREIKRAIAVKMQIQGVNYKRIQELLSCSQSFISKWKGEFSRKGTEGLKLKYKGSKSYLSVEQQTEIIRWIETQNGITRELLEQEILNRYSVVFASEQSYYDLLKKGGVSGKKSQKKKK